MEKRTYWTAASTNTAGSATPLFAIARISGRCAHRLEELISCKRIIRPAYRSSMKWTNYVPIDERG